MNGKGRGRGLGRGIAFGPDAMLRGSANLKDRQSNDFVVPITTNFEILCTKLCPLELRDNSHPDLLLVADATKKLCKTNEDLFLIVDIAHSFSMQSKMNAHTCAILCSTLGDFEVDNQKFKILLLRKFQHEYQERKERYKDLKQFLSNLTFLCEVFYHMRVPDGSCYTVLVSPILDYFEMLLDGESEEEIEAFAEQMRKCYKDLFTHKPEAVDKLLLSVRARIISKTLLCDSRALLLQLLEHILTNWTALPENVKKFYQQHTGSPSNICI